MRSQSLVSLGLSVLACAVVATVMWFSFTKRPPSDRATADEGRIESIQERVGRLESTIEKLSAKLDELAARLNLLLIGSPRIPVEPKGDTGDHVEDSSATKEPAIESAIPVPWRMRFGGGFPTTFDDVLTGLGLKVEDLSADAVADLLDVFDEYVIRKDLAFAAMNSAIASAALEMEAKGEFMSPDEYRAFRESERKKGVSELRKDGSEVPEGPVTTHTLGSGRNAKHFRIRHSQYSAVAQSHLELLAAYDDFKHRVYEVLVGPVPERIEDSRNEK